MIHRSFVSVVLVVTFVSAVSFRSFRFDGFVLAFRVLVHAANRDITKSSKPARLAKIQLNSLVQKQINLAKPIYDEISKYSQ